MEHLPVDFFSSIPLELRNFHCITEDKIIKILWLKGSVDTKKFFYRVIGRLVGYDISDFDFSCEVQPSYSYEGKMVILDFFLISKDQSRKINVEINNVYGKYLMNRNQAYLFRIASEFYIVQSGTIEDYRNNLLVDQVNLNKFKFRKNKKVGLSKYTMYDKKNNLNLKSVRIINVYLPTVADLEFNKTSEKVLDYNMFMVNSFEQMAECIKGNKERESVMMDLKKIIKNNKLYTSLEEADAIKRFYENDMCQKEYKKGIKRGVKKGINKGRKDVIKELISNGMPKEELSKYLSTPII